MALKGKMCSSAVLWLFAVLPALARAAVLFPYSASEETPRTRDGFKRVDLPNDIPVFGTKYSQVWISNNGYLQLTGADSGGWNVFQLIDWSKQEGQQFKDGTDPVFVIPYYARTEPNKASRPGHVYYETGGSSSPFVLSAQAALESSVTSAEIVNFKPTTGLMVTWSDLTFNGAAPRVTVANTFQAVLLSDGVDTYSIFNYDNTSWTGGPSEGGDANTGLGATVPPAQAGFNLGGGKGFVSLPYSGTDRMVDLDSAMGSAVKGRFVYNIGSTMVDRGSCTPADSDDKRLVLSRSIGSIYGGEDMYVSGPCLEDGATLVYCRFFAEKSLVASLVKGVVVSFSRVRCVPPRTMYRRDAVKVELSTDRGQTWEYSGSFDLKYKLLTVELLESGNFAVLTPDPDELSLRWNTNLLSCNYVDIWLMGYKEDQNKMPSWRRLRKLASGGMFNGLASFKPSENGCETEEQCSYEIGLIEVACASDAYESARRLHSQDIPLGWYVNQGMRTRNGVNWVRDKCESFYESDGKDTKWLEALPSCPCSLSQARADLGRWEPDPGCDENANNKCIYHRGAKHCVRSVRPSPDGAGNQCCYRPDGSLMHSLDSTQGSTPDKGYYSGAPPYGRGPLVPQWSHWLDDVITFYYCCLWTEGLCDRYMERRATRDCVNYETPKSAMACGDPHFSTFDSNTYTFNGKGEFWLLKADDMAIQGRFEQLKINDGFDPVFATGMTSVVMKPSSGDAVELKLNPPSERWRKTMTVLLGGGEEINFGAGSLAKRRFNGFTILNNEPIGRQRNFTIRFDNEIGVMVTATEALMQITVIVPPQYKDKTRGLLGSWDDNTDNDFETRSGVVVTNTSGEHLHKNYGLSWMVTNDESYFFYTMSERHDTFNDSSFVPFYEMPPHPNTTFTEAEEQQTCMGNRQCLFDYRATGNAGIARSTLLAVERYNAEIVALETDYRSCGVLQVKHSKKSNYRTYIGSMVKVTGCVDGYALTADETEYECLEHSDGTVQWDKAVSARCIMKAPVDPAETGMTPGETAGLVIGIIIAVAAILILLGVIFWWRRRNQARKNKQVSGTDAEKGGKPASKDNDGFEEVPLDTSQPTKSYRFATADRPSDEPQPAETTAAQSQQPTKSYRFATADQAEEEEIAPKKSSKLSFGPLKLFGSKKSKTAAPAEEAKENEGYQSEEGLEKSKKPKSRLFKKKSESSPYKQTPATDNSETKESEPEQTTEAEDVKQTVEVEEVKDVAKDEGVEKTPEVAVEDDKPSETKADDSNVNV